MAKVNFNNLDDVESVTNSGNNGSNNDVGFFTLKNDNDEAVVRFMIDTTDDFEILTCHDVQIGQRYRKVNCIRDPREPIENCPLCANNVRISNRFFIKLIQYNRITDPNTGAQKVVPMPMIWERSTAYAKTLKSYIDNYGPLSDIICKIIRHGKAGDMQTTYEIVPNLSKSVFPDEIYVKDPTLFGTFEAFGTIVMDRTFDEMSYFVANGEFPARQANSTADSTQNQVTPRTSQTTPVPTPTAPQQTAYAPTAAPMTTPTYAPSNNFNAAPSAPGASQTQPWNNTPSSQGGFDRPRRY